MPARLVLFRQGGGDGGDVFGLVLGLLAFEHADRRAFRMLAPQFLFVQVRVVRDQLVGRAQDALAAAVVLLQLDHAQARPVAAELVDVLRIGAAPGVDRLVVVAHAGDPAALAGQHFQQAVLRVVGVLVFVHQQVAQALAPGIAAFGIGFEDAQRQPDQVVEIDRVERGQALLVHVVDGRRFQLARAARRGERFLRRKPAVLGAAEQVADAEQHVVLRALRRELLDDAGAVVRVQHGETPAQAGARVFDLQEFQAQCVEGADRERGRVLRADQLGHAFAHLLRRLVGEGDRGDLRGCQSAALDQVRDLLRDHAGLAGTGAGEYQQRAVAVFDGGQLLRIEHGSKDGRGGGRW